MASSPGNEITKPTPAQQQVLDALTKAQQGGSGVYIGVQAGSDLEKYGYQGAGYGLPGSTAGAKYGGPFRSYYGTKKPLYKVGYQNSKDFARELGNMNPYVIYVYQQRLNAAGLLDTFVPGKLDKATRAAFKELLSTANQSATTWQSTLQDIESVDGVVGSSSSRQPFVAQLDDPTTLRETFQSAVQSIYGGDLPDDEINAMVDAYRSQQLAKQQAAYNAQETGGQVDTETNPSAFALAEVQAKHPDQVARVKFSDTLGTILKTFSSQTPGA